jgi:hypothetical protein
MRKISSSHMHLSCYIIFCLHQNILLVILFIFKFNFFLFFEFLFYGKGKVIMDQHEGKGL